MWCAVPSSVPGFAVYAQAWNFPVHWVYESNGVEFAAAPRFQAPKLVAGFRVYYGKGITTLGVCLPQGQASVG